MDWQESLNDVDVHIRINLLQVLIVLLKSSVLKTSTTIVLDHRTLSFEISYERFLVSQCFMSSRI